MSDQPSALSMVEAWVTAAFWRWRVFVPAESVKATDGVYLLKNTIAKEAQDQFGQRRGGMAVLDDAVDIPEVTSRVHDLAQNGDRWHRGGDAMHAIDAWFRRLARGE